ncbi:hypothetical protein, partial [Mesorhizobium sp.]|uniref:hypothetical protein n=1 Tax=Mesorhizobium sp. TaxID=1871066 RepID=UPI0025BD5DB7
PKSITRTIPAPSLGASQNIFRHILHFALVFPALKPLLSHSTQRKRRPRLVAHPDPKRPSPVFVPSRRNFF